MKASESESNKTLIELDFKSNSHAESESATLTSNEGEDNKRLNKDLKGVNVLSRSLIFVFDYFKLFILKKLTFRMALCLVTCCFGASFQIGWSMVILNTPSTVWKYFCSSFKLFS